MKIDLFGATGFIGSKFKQKFSEEVYSHPRDNNIPEHQDILYMISTTDNYNVFDNLYIDANTNIIKLLQVLENCKNKNITFNFVSSWFVYGECCLPAKEDDCCKPKGFYSITKKCAEDLLISYCQTFKINYRIFRLCNVYGPNDLKTSKKKNALQYLISEIKNDKNINLYYNGDFIRDYMHVEDVCDAIHLCMKKADVNQIINIGSGKAQNFRELIDFCIKETQSSSKITAIDAVEFHKIVQVKDMYLDNTKIQNLGFSKKIDIYDGLKQIIQTNAY